MDATPTASCPAVNCSPICPFTSLDFTSKRSTRRDPVAMIASAATDYSREVCEQATTKVRKLLSARHEKVPESRVTKPGAREVSCVRVQGTSRITRTVLHRYNTIQSCTSNGNIQFQLDNCLELEICSYTHVRN